MQTVIDLLQRLLEQCDALLAAFQRPVVEESIPVEPEFQTYALSFPQLSVSWVAVQAIFSVTVVT
jgi:hypothetical protein